MVPSQANKKDEIILNLEKINNLTFNFKQIINGKEQRGECIIEYPKKIFCLYDNKNKKMIISNGKSLVVKNKNINQYYLYPIEKTPLALILDKEYLINSIKKLQGRIVDKKYLNFTLKEKNNKKIIFFNSKTLGLTGWQTEDIYENLTITFISNIKVNKKIDKKKFILPKNN